MKKLSVLVFLSIIISFNAQSQNLCGTTGSLPRETEANIAIARNGTSPSCSYLIRVRFHIVTNSNGTGGQNASVLSTVMANLTNSFWADGIAFQNMGYDEINNDYYMSSFVNGSSGLTKFNQLISTNVDPNSINVYLWPDNHPTWFGGQANGVGGTSYVIGGSAFFFVGGSQISVPFVPTLYAVHEMGHCLGLYHTFETKVTCAELVNESNCTTCGDKVCDTPAESQNYIWAENANCVYTTNYQDATGATYNPIVGNIMNYARPSCLPPLLMVKGLE